MVTNKIKLNTLNYDDVLNSLCVTAYGFSG